MSLILDGKKAAIALKEQLKIKIAQIPDRLSLAIIYFNDPASLSYLKGRKRIADELGIDLLTIAIDETTSQEVLLSHIHQLNEDQTVHGIMIDRPLPTRFSEEIVLSAISEQKDVDGVTPANIGKLLLNRPCFHACTPKAAIFLLRFYQIPLEGKNVLIIGRSISVGKPLALLLLNENATVTVAHSKTTGLKEKCKAADIIFLCVGKKSFLHLDDVKKEAIVVDIGINYDNEGKICGDADKDLYDQIFAYSPVPGGVGVLTNLLLMQNVIQSYEEQ